MGNQNGLAIANAPAGSGLVLDTERMELLRKSIANGAPQMEFELFVADCNRRGLDPFAKQTYLIKRGNKWQQQTSIDGYRLIADRSGAYAGSDEPVFDVEDAEHPNRASVTVWKLVDGQRCPFTATARWSEYAVMTPVWDNSQRVGEKLSDMWSRMPYTMLAKCAESAALRKAFPQELSGLYTHEEMQQADSVQPPAERMFQTVVSEREMEMIEEEQFDEREIANRRFFSWINKKGLSEDERRALHRIAYGVESAKELTAKQLDSLVMLIHDKTPEELRERIKQQQEIDAQAAQEAQPEPDYSDHDPASPIPDFLRRIAAATDEKMLYAITAEMQALAVWDSSIPAAISAKRTELGLPAPKPARTVNDIVEQAPLAADGEPGNDRHTS